MDLFVESLGVGVPDRVFLHGLAGSGRYWLEDFRVVRGRRRFIDLAGFGRSMRAPGKYDLSSQAERLEDLRPCPHLVGHSMGALIALLCASRWDEVETLTLFNLPAYPNADEGRAALAAAGPMEQLLARESAIARGMCFAMCHARGFFGELAPALARDVPPEVARDGVLHTWRSFSEAFASILDDNHAADWLAKTSARVTVVLADDDLVCPPALVRPVIDSAGKAEVLVWPGTHQLPLESAARCAALVDTL